MIKTFNIISILIVVCCISFAQDSNDYNSQEFKLIDEDAELNFEEALLEKFYFVFDKEKLNPKYLGKVSLPLKCATGLMNEYHKNRDILSSKAINEIDEYLNRPFKKTASSSVYISLSGRFELTYSTTGADAVPAADGDNNGIPDYIEFIADYFDYSWDFTVDSLGYSAPPIGTGRYQIGFEEMVYYGYTEIVSGKLTRIVMHRNFNRFPNNSDPDGKIKGAAKATAIHEFKHAVQCVYNNWNDPGWFIEMDATWMEDIGYDNVNDYYNYLPSSQLLAPSRSFAQGAGYEDCLWLHYISEKHDVLSNRLIWERRAANGSENIFSNFNNILGLYSSSFAEALKEYFVWNYSTGSRATGLLETYGEADKYPTSSVCFSKNSFPDSSSGCGLNQGTANYLRYNSTNENRFLSTSFNAEQNGEYGIEVLIFYKNNSVEKRSIDLNGLNNLNFMIAEKLSDINYFIIIPVLSSTSGGLRNYTCKISSFQTAEFIFSPVKDTEIPVDQIITAQVITAYNIALTDSFKLFYKVDAGNYTSVKMIPTENNSEFSALIPSVPSGSTVKYYFSIYDTLDSYTYYPETAPLDRFSYYTGADISTPSVLHTPKTRLNKFNFPITLYAEVDDNIGVDSVYAEFRINDSEVSYFRLDQSHENLYSDKMSFENNLLNAGDKFEYKIIAVDISTNQNKKTFPDEGYITNYLLNGYRFTSVPNKVIKSAFPLGIKDTIEITDDLIISDFNLAFNATHNRISDLTLRIIPPFRNSTNLFMRPGLGTPYGNAKNPDIIFDQEAYLGFKNFEPLDLNEVTGEYRPDTTNFNNFNGYNAKGRWILIVTDFVQGEDGILNEWGIIIGTDITTNLADENLKPSRFDLMQNYPNPFNPATIISFTVSRFSFVTLKIYDVLGNEIASVISEHLPQGQYQREFDAAQYNLTSGIYFYRLETGGFSSTKKMILLK